MKLFEIIKDITLEDKINPNSTTSLSKQYDINGTKMSGTECIGQLIAATLARGYKLEVEKIHDADIDSNFTIGPEKYLTILYNCKIVNELASRYNFITKDTEFHELDTWGWLRGIIFNAIIKTPQANEKLKSVNLSDNIPPYKKTNKDQTVTTYEYNFYSNEEEKDDWANPSRLRKVSFEKGYLKILIDMPIKEVPSIPGNKRMEETE